MLLQKWIGKIVRKKGLTMYNYRKLKDTIQDSNINFLIGSGISNPYLATLNNIETLLTNLSKRYERQDINETQYKTIRASIYKTFFRTVIDKNLGIIDRNHESKEVLDNYIDFFRIINQLLLKRKSTILSKQINLFTTNIDIFLDMALELAKLECNDGFSGRFVQSFQLSNFKKSFFRTSLHYDNISEIPVFNLLKVHGSLSWITKDDEVVFSPNLENVRNVRKVIPSEEYLVSVNKDSTVDSLIANMKMKTIHESVELFIKEYDKLMIVNPTKDKFKLTVLNEYYYELLRIYSNELEKENSVLFVMGFSFDDEHILDLTFRSLDSNPTLKLFYLSYENKIGTNVKKLKDNAKNRNIEIIIPNQINENDAYYLLNLSSITKDFFFPVLELIERND